jgi:hypothetical protein
MITKKMRKWLQKLPEEPVNNVKYVVYMKRIQRRITRELDDLLWLCINRPDIMLLETTEINDTTGKIVSQKRMKTLLLCLKNLYPHCEVELVKGDSK